MYLIYYGRHSDGIDQRIIGAGPRYVIVNTLHGLWGEVSPGAPLLVNSVAYSQAGLKLIGYLTSGYEGAGGGGDLDKTWYSEETIKRLITNMNQFDNVHGIFIDECSAYPSRDSKIFLKSLVDFIHDSGLLVWGNVGQDDFDAWYFEEAGFDILHTSERWGGQKLTHVQNKWKHKISVSAYNNGYNASKALNLTLDAWKKGLAHCYITSLYSDLPPWFDEYMAQAIRSEKKLKKGL